METYILTFQQSVNTAKEILVLTEDDVCAKQFRRIRACHIALKEAILATGLPPLPENDSLFYPKLKGYYYAIAEFLFQGHSPDHLDYQQRYAFFVSEAQTGEPYKVSGLERLMGFVANPPDSVEQDSDGPTTKDSALDAIALACMSFPKNAEFLINNFSIPAILKMAELHSEVHKRSETDDSKEGRVIPAQQQNSAIEKPQELSEDMIKMIELFEEDDD